MLQFWMLVYDSGFWCYVASCEWHDTRTHQVSQVVEKFAKYKVQPKNLILDIAATTHLRQYAPQSKNHNNTGVKNGWPY